MFRKNRNDYQEYRAGWGLSCLIAVAERLGGSREDLLGKLLKNFILELGLDVGDFCRTCRGLFCLSRIRVTSIQEKSRRESAV
jgi:hypothetical protein